MQRYIVPREQWPDEPCTEHNGDGWEVEVTKKKGRWALCRFVHATDTHGNSFEDVWRPISTLLPLGHQLESTTSSTVPPAPEQPEISPPPDPLRAPTPGTIMASPHPTRSTSPRQRLTEALEPQPIATREPDAGRRSRQVQRLRQEVVRRSMRERRPVERLTTDKLGFAGVPDELGPEASMHEA